MGGPPVVSGDRRRAHRVPRVGRDLRLHVVRQDRDPRSRRSHVPGEPHRQSRRARRRSADVHADAERRRAHRGRRPRLAEARFRVIPGTASDQHDLFWIRDHAPENGSVYIEDVTSAYSCIGLWGPAARDILQPLTQTNIGNEAFPFLTSQQLAIGSVPCLALRVTYVGELGWELYCPAEFGLRLWDTIWEAGRGKGLVAGGYKAVDSLRLEKGYRAWASDISPESDPYQSGLGFFVKLDKGDFIGRSALLKKREAPAPTKLACLVLDDPRSVALGSEPVRIGGEVAGRVTSGGYGYTVGKSIAYAYVPSSAAIRTPVEVEIFGTWVKGEIAKEP